MREYEVTIILKANLEDETRNQLIERVEGWLTSGDDGANKPVIHHWGQRPLAYPLKDQREGYYVLYEAQMEPQRMDEVEREILFVDDILRHLVVRKNS